MAAAYLEASDIRRSVHALGYESARAQRLARGKQAVCWLLSGEGTDHDLVAKVFDRSDDSAAARLAMARKEFSCLVRFYGALGDSGPVSVPQPLSLVEGLPGYLMSHVPGRRLTEVGRLGPDDRSRIARRVIEGLVIYHAAVGEAFGDFQPDNVLVDGVDLYLVDASFADGAQQEIANRLPEAPLVADLGYWLYSVSARSLRWWVTSPRRALRVRAHTRELMAAAGDRAADAQEVLGVAREHARRLMATGRPRDRVLAHWTLGTLALGVRQP